MESVLVERRDDGIAVVRLNRPEQRNALNIDVRRNLAEVFNGDVRCVILAGNEEIFAAGGDLTEMVDASVIELCHRHTEVLWKRVAEYRKPRDQRLCAGRRARTCDAR